MVGLFHPLLIHPVTLSAPSEQPAGAVHVWVPEGQESGGNLPINIS